MVGQDGRVNVPGLLLVEGPYPRLIVVGADDDGQGRAVDTSGLADLRQPFLALNYDQADWLKVSSGGGHMSGLQNLFQLFRLHLLVGVAADGAAGLCNCDKVHSKTSFLIN